MLLKVPGEQKEGKDPSAAYCSECKMQASIAQLPCFQRKFNVKLKSHSPRAISHATLRINTATGAVLQQRKALILTMSLGLSRQTRRAGPRPEELTAHSTIHTTTGEVWYVHHPTLIPCYCLFEVTVELRHSHSCIPTPNLFCMQLHICT